MSNLVPLSSVPIEVRKHYALALVKLNVLDAIDALSVTVDPGDTLVPYDRIDMTGRGFCPNGHPWSEGSYYTRPNGSQYCRECARQAQRQFRRKREGRYVKVPCATCGAPACPPEHKKWGYPEARCRKCFMESRKGRRAA